MINPPPSPLPHDSHVPFFWAPQSGTVPRFRFTPFDSDQVLSDSDWSVLGFIGRSCKSNGISWKFDDSIGFHKHSCSLRSLQPSVSGLHGSLQLCDFSPLFILIVTQFSMIFRVRLTTGPVGIPHKMAIL